LLHHRNKGRVCGKETCSCALHFLCCEDSTLAD
jgi:hypothetical protein